MEIFDKPKCLVVALWTQKYLRSKSFEECEIKVTDSQLWRKMIKPKGSYSHKPKMRVGSGEQFLGLEDQRGAALGRLKHFPAHQQVGSNGTCKT